MNIGFAFPMNQLPWWLLLAMIVMAGLVVALRWLERNRDLRLGRFVDLRLGSRLLLGHDARMRRPLFWFTILGFAFLILAFFQPRWGQRWQTIQRNSHDILVLLDTSESMRADNPQPHRMERAKQKIASILDRTPGDRFGLVAFSGAAELMCPLTLDRGYYRSVLDAVDTDSISLEGTDIAAAFELAVEIYQEEDEESGGVATDSRAILLVSDGEEVSGDALAAAEKAGEYARIFVIGVGTPRGAEVSYVTNLDHRQQVAPHVDPHISKLDEETLTRVALAGKGGYSRSTPDNRDVDALYSLISQLGTRDVSGDLRLRLVNRYQWPLSVAVACFLAEGFWLVMLPWLRSWRSARRPAAEGQEYA